MSNGKSKNFWCVFWEGWSLPVECESPDDTDIISVKPAEIPMINPMIEALIRVLDSTCVSVVSGRWMIVLKKLRQIAEPIPEDQDPQDWVTWPQRVPINSKGFWKTHMFEEFLYRSNRFVTRDQASLCFRAVATAMCDWFVNWKKPIDFGFFEICPLPLRRNWKEVLYWKVFRGKTGNLTLWDMRHHMLSGRLSALFNKARLFHWTLDIKHKKGWWEACHARESKLSNRSGESYGRYHYASIKSASEKAYDIFKAYIAEIRATLGFVARGHNSGDYGLAVIRNGPITRGSVPKARASPVPSGLRLRPSGKSGYLAPKDKRLLELRSLQSQVPHLRHKRRKVAQPVHPKGGADGVPVLDAPGGEVKA